MATPVIQIPENINTTRTSVSISGPAYMVAVGGSPRGAKAKPKPKKDTIPNSQILSRYLRAPTSSCHDRCKHGMQDGSLELKTPARNSGSRKMPVVKTKGVERNVVPLDRKKMTKTTTKPSSDPKTSAPAGPAEVTKREPSRKVKVSKATNRMPKNQVKTKPVSVEGVGPKPRNHKLASPLKDQTKKAKNKLKQLIAQKVQEMTKMTLNEAEIAEVELVIPTKLSNLLDSESFQSDSEEQVSTLEAVHGDNEKVNVCEDDYEIESSEEIFNYGVVNCEDNEDGEMEVKFRRGRVLELESGDNGLTRLKFRRGRVLEDNGDGESVTRISFKKVVDKERNDHNHSEKVNLKHQEQERKEAQELLNRVIEETANKLVEDKKTKVGALVGAFETVISLHDNTPSSDDKETRA